MAERPAPLDIEVEVRVFGNDRVTFVTPTGEIDLASADELAAVLGSPRCAETSGLVLDLRQVSFMDSSGLRVVLLTARDREPSFAALIEPESAVERLIELVDVADRIHAAGGEEEALQRIGAAGVDAEH